MKIICMSLLIAMGVAFVGAFIGVIHNIIKRKKLEKQEKQWEI